MAAPLTHWGGGRGCVTLTLSMRLLKVGGTISRTQTAFRETIGPHSIWATARSKLTGDWLWMAAVTYYGLSELLFHRTAEGSYRKWCVCVCGVTASDRHVSWSIKVLLRSRIQSQGLQTGEVLDGAEVSQTSQTVCWPADRVNLILLQYQSFICP